MPSPVQKQLRQVASKTLTQVSNSEIKIVGLKRYIVTAYVAAPGTPLKEGGTSLPGHLYYSIAEHGAKSISYGFAPIKHGEMIGPGKVYDNDEKNYLRPLYARVIEIKESQYILLKKFGDNPHLYKFSMEYEHAKNNCVDFVWNALNKAGLKATLPYATALDGVGKALNWAGSYVDASIDFAHEGDLKPIDNVDSIASIVAPYSKSELNKEIKYPLPKERNWKQHILSQEGSNNGDQYVV